MRVNMHLMLIMYCLRAADWWLLVYPLFSIICPPRFLICPLFSTICPPSLTQLDAY